MKTKLVILLILVSCLAASAQIIEKGVASFYDDKFNGRITASGEIFDQSKLTAAHRTFPFGTLIKVTNTDNNKTVELTINDRGPYVKDRIIDVSKKAAQELGFTAKGTAKVKIEVVKLGANAIIDSKNSPASKSNTEKATPVSQEKPKATNSTLADEALEYYKLESEIIEPKGFGIQVASYQEAANLIKRCSEIRSKTNKDVIVQVADSQGKKVYRIIIGTFATHELAEEYFKKQGNQFPGSFVFGF